jgi:hypothetical protein
MITAYLVGDKELSSWLCSIPDAVNTSLVPAITKLGIDLQRKIQEGAPGGQLLAARFRSLNSSIDLQIDQSADGVTATLLRDSGYARTAGYGSTGRVGVKNSLRQIKDTFRRPLSGKAVSLQSHSPVMNVPEHSFLLSALEEMEPAIRQEVEAALSQAVKG